MRAHLLPSLLLLSFCACSSTPSAEAPAAFNAEDEATDADAPGATAEPDAAAKPKHACGDGPSCAEAGAKARKDKDNDKARELLTAACDQGSAEGCGELAHLLSSVDKTDPNALVLRKKACELDHAESCFNGAEDLRKTKPKEAAAMYAKACKGAGKDAILVDLACGRGGIVAFQAGEHALAAEIALAACNETRASSCNILGVLHVEGKGGIKADRAKALAAFEKACKAGIEEGCNNQKKLENSLDVPGANINMGKITADGFTLTDMQCKAEGAGLGALLLGPVVAGTLGKKKAALDACAPQGADVRVRWTSGGGKVSNVEAKAADPKIEACVVKVVKTVPGVLEGVCAASMRVGKP